MTIRSELKAYADQLEFSGSERLARLFDLYFDHDDMVRVVQAMPGTLDELAERTKLTVDRVRRICLEFRRRGVAVGFPFEDPYKWRMIGTMVELRDSSMFWPEAPQALYEIWDQIISRDAPRIIAREKFSMIRVVPIERSVEVENTVLDIDSARKIFKDAELISAVSCACRTMARKNGRGHDCPSPEANNCMQTGVIAQAVLARGIAERLTNEEALKRIGDSEDAGLVRAVRNNVKPDMIMCNCCECCCTALHFFHHFGHAGAYSPSRFQARVDEEACVGCGTCVDRCLFKAIAIKDDVSTIDYEKCYGCGNCAVTCPEEAMTLLEVRPKEHIRIS